MPITEGFELVYEQSDSERVFFAERANCYTSGEPDGKRLLVSELYASHGTDHGDFACNAVAVIGDYLAGLDLHLPFETMPAWAARALLTPADQLEKLGLNLASSYHALKNNFGRAQWDHTLEYIRLGLGERGTGAPSAALRCWAACEGEKRRRAQGTQGTEENEAHARSPDGLRMLSRSARGRFRTTRFTPRMRTGTSKLIRRASSCPVVFK